MVKTVPYPSMDEILRKSGMSREDLAAFLDLVKRSMIPEGKQVGVREQGVLRYLTVVRQGVGILNTPFGKFWHYDFTINDNWRKYSAIVRGEIDTTRLVPLFSDADQLVVRTDSGCETGQLFKDHTCECADQLYLAMQTLAQVGEGIIVSIPRQDGRGMGLPFKLATLWLQDVLHINTVESAGLLVPDGVIDTRTYAGVIGILKFFGVPPSRVIQLATNNPDKAGVFRENGYTLGEYVPVIIAPTEHTAQHLRAKHEHLGHNLATKEHDHAKNE